MSTTQPPSGIKQVMEYLSSAKAEIQNLLPPDVDLDRFTQTTIVAITQNPDVLNADRQSLYNAIARAASDGLMPDGREGALVIFNQKVSDRQAIKVVKWMPMVEGIIRQLGKAGIAAYAASVYEGEEIKVWNDDAGQHVEHSVNPFQNRCALMGVFAAATVAGKTYVETLNLEEIEAIRASSRAPEGGPWDKWYGRMAQKSVLHRIKKRLPILDRKVVAALRDPEEEPDLAPPTPMLVQPEKPAETPPQPTPERHKPRSLNAVVEAARAGPAVPKPATSARQPDGDPGEVF
jgi:recombination protein RecT